MTEGMVKRNALRWIWLSIFVIVLDQLTKQWALQTLTVHEPVVILPVLNWFLAFNKGAAFSFLAHIGGFAVIFFAVLATIISTALLVWLAKTPSNKRWLACGIAFVIGGALGNLIDRVYHGHVVDFIQLHIDKYYWPSFNIADTAISVGAIMILIDMIFFSKKSKQSIEAASNE